MSKLLQLRGGTTSEHSTFTGALREVTVDTDKDTLVVHDGSTAGGHALPRTAAEVVALISNDAIDSQHYAAGSIDLEHMSAESVDEDNLHISNAGTNGQYLQKQSGNAGGLTWGTVDLTTLSGANLTSGIIPTARIDASSIDNDLIDSQHYAAGSVDLEHMSAQSVDEDNLHISNVGTNGQYLQKQSGNAGGLTWTTVDLTTLSAASLTSGIVPTARIDASSIANDLLDSQHYAAASIDTEHLAASIALGGSPTTTTQTAADNSTKIATTAYTDAAIAALADSAPATLNTLNELAAALGDDANYATTTATAIGTKMPLAGGAFSGAVTTNSTFDGRDVSVDGTKLDGIAASATNVTNNNQITNGAGYITSYVNTTYTAGTGMSLAGTVFNCTIDTPAEVGLGNLSSSGNALSGSFTATGNITAYSDERLKSNVETIPNALEKVLSVRGVTFDMNEERGTGVIAQELEKALPEAVFASTKDGMKSVAYGNVVGLLIEAIKEQQVQIETLMDMVGE